MFKKNKKENSKLAKVKNSKAYRTFSTVKNTIAWFFVVIIAIAMVIFVITRINGNTPSVFGYTIFRVSSGSMEPELMIGDIIIDESVDSPDEISVGDNISFDGKGDLSGKIITHKVIVAPHEDERGKIVLQTKGVANPIPDDPIEFSDIRGKQLYKVPYVDKIYNFFLSQYGLIVFLLLIILIFLDEIVNLIRIIIHRNDVDIDEIIRKIKEEENEKQGEQIQDNDDD